jgi:hypothetical protein
MDGHFVWRPTSGAALLVAIIETQQSGGGTIWIHRKGCQAIIIEDECPCDPVSVEIEEDLPN